ncbi:MAG: FkbM family methyltransferase [Candidatus Hodarchaeota archaeon]
MELLSIRLDHEVSRRFIEYMKKNKSEVETFLNDLDVESKNEIKTIIENLEFMSNHTLVETVQKFTSDREKLLKQLYNIELIKDKYKLSFEVHEEAIFKYKHGLKDLPQEVINTLRNKIFLDCGAFSGDSALVFEKEYHPSKIYSFEPVKENYEYLLETIKLNNLEKVVPIQKGVGEENCIVNFSSFGAASSCVVEEGNERSEVICIDDFVIEHDLLVGLIKMDVEGYEFEALKGAKKTIKKFKPVLLISIYHHPEELFGTKKYIQEMVPDYKFKIKQLADLRPLGEIHLIAW